MEIKDIKICILTVFYNTPFLFLPLYKSFKKMSGISNFTFEIFDNSDNENKKLSSALSELDDVNLSYVNTETLYNDIPKTNGSAKHTKTIDYALEILKDKYDFCILLDSDVVITKSIVPYIKKMITENFALCGYHDITYNRNLIHPCAMIINLSLIKNIHFYDKNRMYCVPPTGMTYDTGMSFTEDVIKNKLKIFEISYNEYSNHFGAGSRNYKNAGKVQIGKIYRDINEWLTDFSWTFN